MVTKDFLQTMISHYQKQVFLKFELLEYDVNKDDFVPIDTVVVQERKLPSGVSNVNGGIEINVDQDVRTTLELQITNSDGLNNWDARFDSSKGEFKWWLDKRLIIHLGLMIDGTNDIEYVQLGYFIITNFETNHSLTEFPVINISGSSKEALFATRRGKFLFPTTLTKNAVMTDTIRTLLTGLGEKDSRILIDPQINKTSIKIDDGEIDNLSMWRNLRSDVTLTVDTTDKAHGNSSLRFDVTKNEIGVLAERTWTFPVDLSGVNAMALWTRCSRDVPENGLSLWLYDKSGEVRELPLRQLVGHVIEDDTVVPLDNWRNVVLPIENFDTLTRVYKMELTLNQRKMTTPFSFWIDQIYCAELRNMLPYELTYSAGATRWSAIKELADLLDAECYYDEYGNFRLDKRKYPKEMNTNKDFEYDAFNVLQPVITYSDTQVKNNMYAGTTNIFDESELSNHVNVVGGSTSSSVVCMADMALRVDGLHIREKGKTINSRGKIRAIDQFSAGTKPTILNGNTNVEEVYKGHQNLDAVIKEYPNGFPHLVQPPLSNFAIERIGDFIYHHNNANADPVIYFTYEAKNRCLYELRKKLAYSEQLDLLSVPFFVLKGDDIIRVEDSLLEIKENFQVKSISMPLNGEYMSITATKIQNMLIDIPYFDISGLRANACWYNYDLCALAFTYPLQDRGFN